MCFEWLKTFKEDRISDKNNEWYGRPLTSRANETVKLFEITTDQLHEKI